MPSIIKVDQIQSDTGTVNVSSNLQFSGSSSTMQVGKTLYLANTNNFALDFQPDVSGRFRIASSLSTFGDNNPFIIERPSSVGGQNDAITIRAGGVVDLGKGQLKFPASQNASSDPNTLDDYEEGTFTPSFSNLSGTATYDSRYLKIGRIVYISLRFAWTSASGGTFSASLPFTAGVVTSSASSGSVFYQGPSATSIGTLSPHVSSGSSGVSFYRTATSSFSSLSGSEVNGSYELLTNFFYFV
jgi:hypothetical protein